MSDQSSSLQRRRKFFFQSFSAIAFLVFVAFGIDNLLASYGTPTLGYVYLATATVILSNVLLLPKLRNITLAGDILLAMVTVILLALLVHGGIGGVGILWYFTLPPAAFILGGRVRGAVWVGVLYLAAAAVVGAAALGQLTLPFSLLQIRQLALSLLVVTILIYLFEKNREESERVVTRQTRKLQAVNRALRKQVDLDEQLRQLAASNREIDSERKKLATLLENLPVGVMLASAPGGEVTMVNRAGQEILGRGVVSSARRGNYARPYAVTREDGTPYPDRELPLTITLTTGTPVRKAGIFIRRPGGSARALEVLTAPIKDADGAQVGALAVFEDQTEQYEIQKTKDDFVALVSHQLKTPIAEIRGYLDNMLRGLTGELNSKQRQYLQEMREISIRDYRLINDLLSVSMLERGVIAMNIKPTKLSEVVATAVRDYRRAIKEKGLTLRLRQSPRETTVLADADKLHQALDNVLDNAVKFTDRGSITVTTRRAGKFAEIVVTDMGSGLSPSVLKRIFQKGQALTGTPRPRGSVGLGLYISREFMRLQHGDLTASSRPGQGAAFTFRIPLAKRKVRR